MFVDGAYDLLGTLGTWWSGPGATGWWVSVSDVCVGGGDGGGVGEGCNVGGSSSARVGDWGWVGCEEETTLQSGCDDTEGDPEVGEGTRVCSEDESVLEIFVWVRVASTGGSYNFPSRNPVYPRRVDHSP